MGQDGPSFYRCTSPMVSQGHYELHAVDGTHKFGLWHMHVSHNVVLLRLPDSWSSIGISDGLVHWGFTDTNSCYPHDSNREDPIRPGDSCVARVDLDHHHSRDWYLYSMVANWESRKNVSSACFLFWIFSCLCAVILLPCTGGKSSLH